MKGSPVLQHIHCSPQFGAGPNCSLHTTALVIKEGIRHHQSKTDPSGRPKKTKKKQTEVQYLLLILQVVTLHWVAGVHFLQPLEQVLHQRIPVLQLNELEGSLTPYANNDGIWKKTCVLHLLYTDHLSQKHDRKHIRHHLYRNASKILQVLQKNGIHLHACFKCGHSYWLCLVRPILPPRVDGIFTSSKQAANVSQLFMFCFALLLF